MYGAVAVLTRTGIPQALSPNTSREHVQAGPKAHFEIAAENAKEEAC